jgi:uncharacterized iron-regulated membrane protein
MSRKLHRIAVWISGVPLLLIVCTGILLQLKAWIPWIEPPVENMGFKVPAIDFATVFKVARSVPAADVKKWADIRNIDVRPAKGIANVRTRNEYEISIDLETGHVVQAAPRRTSLLIQLHEGSFFGKEIKYGVFLPVAILFFVLWATGIYLLFHPQIVRYRKRTKS